MITMTDPQFFTAMAYGLIGLTLLWHMLRRTIGSYAVSVLSAGAVTLYFAAAQSDRDLKFALAAFIVNIIVVIPLTSVMGWRSK